MKYLLGRVSLSACFFISLSLSANDIYRNMERKGSVHIPDSLLTMKNSSDSTVKKQREASYSFLYMLDNYGIEDRKGQGIFEKIYAQRHGTLLASYDSYWYRNKVSLIWGFGMGLGYNQGNPKFLSDADKSEIIFRLYTALLDASVGVELRPVSFLTLMFKGGPSLMGLYRSRSDFDSGEDGKNVRQMGVGGAAHGAVKIGTGELFSSWGEYLRKEYGIDGLSLNMGVRYHHYSGFNFSNKSKIKKVDGLSYAVGLSFEFL